MSPSSPLAAQLRRWEQAGLLSPEQAQAILRFEAEQGEPSVKRAFSPAVMLSLIGALVLGLGLIALVAANWGTLPRTLKFAGLVALTLTSYGAGYWLRDREGATWPATGAALYLLGGVLFGAVLGFLSQGMQLGVSINTLLALWGVGLLVLAYGVKLPPALHLALPLGAVIPLLGLYGGDLGWFVGASYGAANYVLILLAGLLALGVTWWHDWRWPTPEKELGRTLGHPWAFWGAPLTLLGLSGAFFSFPHSSAVDALYTLVLAVSCFGLFHWGRVQERRAIQSWSLIGLALSLCALPMHGLWFALLGGVASLGVALWGGQRHEKGLVNIGLVGVGFAVLSVYFSVFMQLLNISLVLVGAGLLLLGLGYFLERTRRRLNAGGEG